jgi:hypothetical protein
MRAGVFGRGFTVDCTHQFSQVVEETGGEVFLAQFDPLVAHHFSAGLAAKVE